MNGKISIVLILLLAGALSVSGCKIQLRDAPASAPDLEITARSFDSTRTEPLFEIRNRNPNQTRPQLPPLGESSVPSETPSESAFSIQPQASNYYEIETSLGIILVRLYDETPGHRDNFQKLVEERFYDGTRFHRVIDDFMIQGGDPNSKDENPMNDGIGGPGYTIPSEFAPELFHKKGALAAARQPDNVNPQRRSSGSQFYIVEGRTYTEGELNQLEKEMPKQVGDPNFYFSTAARQAYMEEGGTPFLDMQYTVFGEVVRGLDVVERIAAVQKNARNMPIDPVTITIRTASAP